jgi:hypothetical protein
MLDTNDAIRERVRRIKMPSVATWRQLKGNGYAGVDGPGDLSTRPDLIVAALEERASADDFGVQYGYVTHLLQALMQRDSPEVSSLFGGDPEAADAPRRRQAALNARATALAFLRRVFPSKSGVAREMTADTIQMLQRDK